MQDSERDRERESLTKIDTEGHVSRKSSLIAGRHQELSVLVLNYVLSLSVCSVLSLAGLITALCYL